MDTNTQGERSGDKSHQYTTRDYVTIYYNNILASLSRSWQEFKEKAHGVRYEIGTWLRKVYKNLTKQSTTYLFKAETEHHAKKTETKELNCKSKPFITPPLHPARGSHDMDQVGVTQYGDHSRM
ncbi:WD_0964 family protein [Wolbachia endosymbiont of Ctenocephalides felis wCfeT]|uniref:WD_0964 family protein n=1 Tax=Wolbachia endosymbiont of Ctenocephalides felis wCfeT TaxID=2732593 RepID=UPI0014484A04|nr:hypothetical protein [Wolbachia endosymbiont of Ctenocephalides felis wCfeT]